MRKVILLLSVLISYTLYSQSSGGTIVNGDFELWNNVTIYDTPTDWQSTSTQEYRGPGSIVVEKSSDAMDGASSIKLIAKEIPNGGGDKDTIRGYVFHGTVGNNGPDGGIAYSSVFNKVKFQVKASFTNVDSLYFVMMRFNTGNPTPVDVFMDDVARIDNVNSSTWTEITVNLSATLQDELFIGFILGSPDGNTAKADLSSWCLVDKVELYNNAALTTLLPNNSFEIWTSVSTEEPESFYTANPITMTMSGVNTEKTTTANSGVYAAKLTTIDDNGSGSIPGILTLGTINFDPQGGSPFSPVAYSYSPTMLTGYYQYYPVNSDANGGVFMDFTKSSSSVGSYSFQFVPQSSYTQFSVPISLSDIPDELLFVIVSGDEIGSVAYIDDLTFSGGGVGLPEVISPDFFEVYPNPSSDYISISSDINTSSSIEIYDAMGKIVDKVDNFNQFYKLNVSNYQTGLYTIKFVSENGVSTKRIMVK